MKSNPTTTPHLLKCLAALLAVASIACPARAEEDGEGTTKKVEYPSPN
jgi:hypothetical protein